MTVLLAADGFMSAFVKSFGVIMASEIGDKTFFIAAVMAMKHPRYSVSPLDALCSERRIQYPLDGQVFAGAILALAAMTVLSSALGWAAPALVRLLLRLTRVLRPHPTSLRRYPPCTHITQPLRCSSFSVSRLCGTPFAGKR
jgi:hypothetical protein